MIEDNKSDVLLIREALETAKLNVDLRVIPDGEKAIRFFEELDGNNSLICPDLAIIDINLPKKHGGEVLGMMRNSRRCANLRVLIVTSSNSVKDRETMASLGIDGYFTKPSQYDDFMKLGDVIRNLLGSKPEAGN